MYNKILIICLVFFLSFLACGKKQIPASNPNNVFVCTGDYAKRYHTNKACDGLKSCKATIEEILKDDALKEGKTLCSKCK